jgi:endonuclease-3 related protein
MEGPFLEIYRILQVALPLGGGWPRGEWPVSGRFSPHWLEVVLGAVLTQNTQWKNAELAIRYLEQGGLTSIPALRNCKLAQLEEKLRPSGCYRRKARTIQALIDLLDHGSESRLGQLNREELLGVVGIGPETADAILLYAAGKPHFVVDTYARRLFTRLGLIPEDLEYSRLKRELEGSLPKRLSLYREYHALIVEHCKTTCRRTPRCGACQLKRKCSTAAGLVE